MAEATHLQLGGGDVTIPGVVWMESVSTAKISHLRLGKEGIAVPSVAWVESRSKAKGAPLRLGGVRGTCLYRALSGWNRCRGLRGLLCGSVGNT